MTKDQAEDILRLCNYPEAESLFRLQADELRELADNMLSRNYATDPRKIDWESGLFKGKQLFSLREMREQARKIIDG